jgi:NAD+ synthase (glutamine-hydrolysing)
MASNLTEYGFYRVACVAPELKVADVWFNVGKIKEACDLANINNTRLILFPELAISGYTCGDIFFQSTLLKEVRLAIDELCDYSLVCNMTIIVGAPIEADGKIFNCAVVISGGEIQGIIPKTYLSNQSEYYEERWFSSEKDRISDVIYWDHLEIPFGANLIFCDSENEQFKFGAEICEDLWAANSPSNNLALAGATAIFNLSASNEFIGKSDYRMKLVQMQSAKTISAYIYASSGPNESTTDTVFSGHCMVFENGSFLGQTERFNFTSQMITTDIDIQKIYHERLKNHTFGGSNLENNYRYIEIDIKPIKDLKLMRLYAKRPFVPELDYDRDNVCEEIFSIQSSGLVKRLRHILAKNVVVGISGGLDSTLALLVIIEAYEKLNLDRKGIISISMPGMGTTTRTRNNAKSLAELLSTEYKELDISKAVKVHFEDIDQKESDHNVVYENAQARERTQILMDIANKYGAIVVGTGDLSEIALGWSTYNADHMSMYNVNSGVPKTLVRYLIEWYANRRADDELKSVLLDICDTPISPELLPPGKDGKIAQKTEEAIGSYELNDFFLYHFIRFNVSPKKMMFLAESAFGKDFDKNYILETLRSFYKRFFANQFKRSCMPDGVKVGTVSLSPRADWRMPSDAQAKIFLDDLWDLD